MRSVVTAGTGHIALALSENQAKDQIVKQGQRLCSTAFRQVIPIFAQRDIPPIVQTILDAPMTALQT